MCDKVVVSRILTIIWREMKICFIFVLPQGLTPNQTLLDPRETGVFFLNPAERILRSI